MIDNLISLTENEVCELIKCPECGANIKVKETVVIRLGK